MSLPVAITTLAILAATGLLVLLRRARLRIERLEEDRAQQEKALDRLRTRLERSRRMEAVGTYAGSITHNLSNLLSVILGHLRLAASSNGAASGSDLERAVTAGRMAADLLADLGAFYREVDPDRRPTDLGPVVRDTVKLLGDLLPSGVEIRSDLQPCGPVLASASGIQQILMILCGQAASGATAGRGQIHITLREEIVAAPRRASPRDLQAGNYVRLTIHDDRDGLDRARLESVLATHYAPGDEEERPGLGHATVTRLIEGMHGAALATGGGDTGAAFSIYLPLIAWSVPVDKEDSLDLLATSGSPEVPAAEPGTAAALHILLVDDEEMVAEILARGLRNLGHKVTMMCDSREALHRVQADPASLDIVITDQIMPHISGVRLAREVAALRSDLPVILVSGFQDSFHAQQARQAGVREFVTKPCSHLDLSAAIDRLGLRHLEGRA